jgi:aspartate dehydrogenase
VGRKSDVCSVGVIGAGTIARAVGERLAAGAVPGVVLRGFLVRQRHGGLPGPEFTSLRELLVPDGVIVEAAAHDAVREFGAEVLSSGDDLVCLSVGALADPALRKRLERASARGGSRLVIPSGAIGALDALRAAAETGLEEVVIEQRKPPRALLANLEAEELTEARVVFDGPVADVVLAYPKTTNVAAAVALAGIGFEKTRAVIVADPELEANQAVLTARGRFGVLRLQLDNVATANPRTSAITAYSVIATLRSLVQPIVVPG